MARNGAPGAAAPPGQQVTLTALQLAVSVDGRKAGPAGSAAPTVNLCLAVRGKQRLEEEIICGWGGNEVSSLGKHFEEETATSNGDISYCSVSLVLHLLSSPVNYGGLQTHTRLP